MSSSTLLSLGLNYLVHSTVLLCAAWLVVRIVRTNAAREWLWRAALVGGVASACLQTFAGVRPWVGSAPLEDALGAEVATRAGVSRGVEPSSVPPTPRVTPPPRRESGEGAAIPRRPDAASRPAGDGGGGIHVGAVVERLRPAAPAFLASALALWWLALGWRTRRAIGRRRRLGDGPWAAQLAELIRDSGVRRRVRLTHSDRIVTPVALGVLRPEICVPTRALDELPPRLARPALAHELGHVARLDPMWLAVAHVVRTLLFFQPLNRLAALELARLAELGADDWAARRTGDRLALARCLTEFAAWLLPDARFDAGCAMVRRNGRLEERVRRLLDGGDAGPTRRGAPVLGAIALVVLAPVALPGWSTRSASSSSPGPAGPAASARTWAGAALAVEQLDLALVSMEARLADLPPEHDVRRERLTERLRALRADLARLRALTGRGASESRTDPGG